MRKKVISLSLIVVIMLLGTFAVSALSVTINVTSSTVLTKDYTSSKANLVSMITSMGYGEGTPGTYIRAYLKSGSTYVQKTGFAQKVGGNGEVTIQKKYVGIGNWRIKLYGKNQETSLNYADWSGMWSYSGQ